MHSDEWLNHMDAVTQTLPRIPSWDEVAQVLEPPTLDRLRVIRDALDLLVDLWPVPKDATVHLETHQWVKLRQVLLAVPTPVAEDER